MVRMNFNEFHTFISDPQSKLPLASGLAPAAFYGPQAPHVAASLLHHPQYMTNGLAPATFYGLQQPMYGANGNTGFENLAAYGTAAPTTTSNTMASTSTTNALAGKVSPTIFSKYTFLPTVRV